ncbi:MAG: metal-dependent transcriptional regulator [Thaumarchaeota archaeon]|nr:metal-dependent transcriptional regulator [Nitrososphaerota archaeon]MDE0525526.1 metal-dependent transcriptional regulator [Nitrososphaerota archaeon]
MQDGGNGNGKEERLFVGTAEAEHVEMYLKAIWHIKERGGEVKITSIADMLHVKQPSVVQMLKKLNAKKLVNYSKAGVRLTDEGERIGASMMRNSRLLEVLMQNALKVEINEEMVCGIEHHMNKQFTDALCTMLNHPRLCPHDYVIPPGECCLSRDDAEGDGKAD